MYYESALNAMAQQYLDLTLNKSRYDEIVELVDKEEFIKDPMGMYENQIFCKGAPLKSAVVWNEKYIDFER